MLGVLCDEQREPRRAGPPGMEQNPESHAAKAENTASSTWIFRYEIVPKTAQLKLKTPLVQAGSPGINSVPKATQPELETLPSIIQVASNT